MKEEIEKIRYDKIEELNKELNEEGEIKCKKIKYEIEKGENIKKKIKILSNNLLNDIKWEKTIVIGDIILYSIIKYDKERENYLIEIEKMRKIYENKKIKEIEIYVYGEERIRRIKEICKRIVENTREKIEIKIKKREIEVRIKEIKIKIKVREYEEIKEILKEKKIKGVGYDGENIILTKESKEMIRKRAYKSEEEEIEEEYMRKYKREFDIILKKKIKEIENEEYLEMKKNIGKILVERIEDKKEYEYIMTIMSGRKVEITRKIRHTRYNKQEKIQQLSKCLEKEREKKEEIKKKIIDKDMKYIKEKIKKREEIEEILKISIKLEKEEIIEEIIKEIIEKEEKARINYEKILITAIKNKNIRIIKKILEKKLIKNLGFFIYKKKDVYPMKVLIKEYDGTERMKEIYRELRKYGFKTIIEYEEEEYKIEQPIKESVKIEKIWILKEIIKNEGKKRFIYKNKEKKERVNIYEYIEREIEREKEIERIIELVKIKRMIKKKESNKEKTEKERIIEILEKEKIEEKEEKEIKEIIEKKELSGASLEEREEIIKIIIKYKREEMIGEKERKKIEEEEIIKICEILIEKNKLEKLIEIIKERKIKEIDRVLEIGIRKRNIKVIYLFIKYIEDIGYKKRKHERIEEEILEKILSNKIEKKETEKVLEILELLYKIKKEIYKKKNEKGENILHMSVRTKNVLIMEKIIEYGIDINERDKEGLTIYHKIAMHGTKEMIEVLMTEKKEIENNENDYKITPIMLGIIYENKKVVKKMLEYEIDNNKKDIFGNTAEHYMYITEEEYKIEKKGERNIFNKTGEELMKNMILNNKKISKKMIKKLNNEKKEKEIIYNKTQNSEKEKKENIMEEVIEKKKYKKYYEWIKKKI